MMKLTLKRELIITLIVKVVLLWLLWLVFFKEHKTDPTPQRIERQLFSAWYGAEQHIKSENSI